ncbi:MAG TPA: 3-(methylthio)propionyl-CoA ligase [Casimicrobiaceae bacterium]|jgi:fatty-acyl-CoA synthase|nr:3-(methylthio)propionyl-CoA ligase [Casimicrobiaceae bacterium]
MWRKHDRDAVAGGEEMMDGLMMDVPLLISSLIRHADRYHGDAEIVSRTVEGPIHRYTYRDAHARARRLARALSRLGMARSDRIGTLAWNGYRHFELYYAVSGMGAITHTINPRLFHDQLAYIINHAEDRIVFFDLSFVALVERLAGVCKGVKHWVAMTDREHLPQTTVSGLLCYEELLAAESDDFDWPEFDENTASGLCYTSGTTGNPKGVLFSHRSTILHAYAISLPDTKCLSASSAVLAIVPMFHVNAWGIPYAAPLVGCKLVFPGPALDGASLYELFESEAVDSTSAVPTVWMNLLNYMQQNKLKFSTLKHTTIGGAACPPAMIRTLSEDFGVRVMHGWGMTEMSPVGTLNAPKKKHATASADAQFQLSLKQGRPLYGVDMKIVDGEGNELARDGKAAGNLLVRGPWIMHRYYRDAGDPLTPDGWLPTGDVGTIDADGYLQITDRSKDVIKSGGEWISSIELENIAVGHPAVLEAAVIGVRHPKWDERPLLIVVKRQGADLTREALLDFYDGKIAKWWLPDDVVFVDELPHTATGKLSKRALRERFRDYRLPTQ